MNKIVSMDEIIPLIEEKINQDGKVIFNPKGNSMFPTILEGVDTVTLVKPVFPLEMYSIVLFRSNEGNILLHRVIGFKNEKYELRGDNKYSSEENISKEQILGVVETYTHEGDTVNAFGPDNKAYAKKRHKTINRRKRYLSIRRFFGRLKK